MVRFEYLEPTTLQEAITVLARHGNRAKALAGGTDLLTQLKERTLRPQVVVNLKRLQGLEGVSFTPGEGLRIGALTTIRVIETSPLVQEKYTALAQAAHLMGSPQVRNLATLGGNLCHAAPSAETAPPLLSFSASVTIAGVGGERMLPLESFFSGPGRTALKEGEILTEIFLPDSLHRSGSVYMKHCPRGSMDLAVVGVAVTILFSSDDDKVEECRIGLGAVAPTPIRARGAEALLRGKMPGESLLKEVGQKASEEACPISDIRGSDAYRRQMINVLTTRALIAALEKAHPKGKD